MTAEDGGLSEANASEGEESRLAAVVPGRLAAPTSGAQLDSVLSRAWRTSAQEVASEWQMLSSVADFWELATGNAIQHGRPHELVGLISGAGEQLAMALTALVETELWGVHRLTQEAEASVTKFPARSAADEMAHRAMADLAAYYLLSTGHAIANITARALALETTLHPHMLDFVGTWYPVASADPKDWASLNRDTAKALRRVAKKASSAEAQMLVEPMTKLIQSTSWHELEQRRGAHYHRRRPQSAGMAGVALSNPWVITGTTATLEYGGRMYTDGDGLARETADLGKRALAQLLPAMHGLLARVQAV
jgi:hypothetical protein